MINIERIVRALAAGVNEYNKIPASGGQDQPAGPSPSSKGQDNPRCQSGTADAKREDAGPIPAGQGPFIYGCPFCNSVFTGWVSGQARWAYYRHLEESHHS